jgi:hypothetical protein
MKVVRDIYKDLDYASAKRHHIMIGRPLDAPVLCPKTIKKMYVAACGLLKINADQGCDYPHDWIDEMKDRTKTWETAAAQEHDITLIPALLTKSISLSKPRNPRQQQGAEEQRGEEEVSSRSYASAYDMFPGGRRQAEEHLREQKKLAASSRRDENSQQKKKNKKNKKKKDKAAKLSKRARLEVQQHEED